MAPRRLVLAEGVTPQAEPLPEGRLREAYTFTRAIYQLYKAEPRLTVAARVPAERLVEGL